MTHHAKRVAHLAGLAILMSACSNGSGPGNGGGGGGGTTSLSVSAATPSNGDGNLTVVGADTADVPFATNGNKIFLALRATSAGKEHELHIYIDPDDGDIPLVEHTWADDLDNGSFVYDGFTICSNTGGFTVCDPAKFSADVAQGTVTLTGLVLGSALGDGDASTLTGTISY